MLKKNLGKNPKAAKADRRKRKRNRNRNRNNNKNQKAKINNIHDKYFKQSFGSIETAKAFMRAYLPKELTEHMDYDSLSIVNPSTIDKNFKLRESDLLYKAEIGKNTWYLYVLLEHKSYIDSRFTLLYYDFSLERQMEIKTDYLPLDLYLRSIQKIYEEDKEKFITIITELFIRISRMGRSVPSRMD